MKETVHTRHCTWRYCKYGEEDFCEVYLGYANPSIKTEEDGSPIEKPSEEEFNSRRDEARNNSPIWDEDR